MAMDTEAQFESAIKYEDNDLEETEAYLKQWTEVLDPIIETIESAGYNSEFPDFCKEYAQPGHRAGMGGA